jgi:hypothetical protein
MRPDGLCPTSSCCEVTSNVHGFPRAGERPRILNAWTGAPGAFGELSAMGEIFVTGRTSPGAELDGATAAAWAADLCLLGCFAVGAQPFGACIYGVDLWFTRSPDVLARF